MVRQLIFGIFLLAFVCYVQFQQEAFAENFQTAQPTFIWKIQTFVEDIRLAISSGADKAELALKFAEQRQNEIDGLLQKGERVPQEIEDRRLQLLEKVEPNKTTRTVIDNVKQDLQTLGELNEIRILYSEFKTCNEKCTDQQKKEFNDNVNSLETWKSKCSGTFDINNYKNTDESFSRLAENHCPDLKKYPKLEINRIFSSG